MIAIFMKTIGILVNPYFGMGIAYIIWYKQGHRHRNDELSEKKEGGNAY